MLGARKLERAPTFLGPILVVFGAAEWPICQEARVYHPIGVTSRVCPTPDVPSITDALVGRLRGSDLGGWGSDLTSLGAPTE